MPHWSSFSAEGGLVEGALFHAPSNAVETGCQFSWNGEGATSFAVAGRYALDTQTFVKGKIDKALNINLSYIQNIRPGVNLRLSADVS